jgi:hypothetical protein
MPNWAKRRVVLRVLGEPIFSETGVHLSRSGGDAPAWTGRKTLKDVIDRAASVERRAGDEGVERRPELGAVAILLHQELMLGADHDQV